MASPKDADGSSPAGQPEEPDAQRSARARVPLAARGGNRFLLPADPIRNDARKELLHARRGGFSAHAVMRLGSYRLEGEGEGAHAFSV